MPIPQRQWNEIVRSRTRSFLVTSQKLHFLSDKEHRLLKFQYVLSDRRCQTKSYFWFLLFFIKYWEAASTASVHPKLIRAPSDHI